MAVVTGGTKGIGRAIALKFASQKFDIATCARNTNELVTLKMYLEQTYGVTVHTMEADLSNKERVKAFTDYIQ